MRKFLIGTLLVASTSFVYAQHAGPTVPPTTISNLTENGKDDQPVVLHGKIIEHKGGEKYRFTDNTGEIEIEVEAKYWPADLRIDDKTNVRLHGEYEKKLIGPDELEVTRIEILN